MVPHVHGKQGATHGTALSQSLVHTPQCFFFALPPAHALSPSACITQQGAMHAYTRNHQQTKIYMHASHSRRTYAMWIKHVCMHSHTCAVHTSKHVCILLLNKWFTQMQELHAFKSEIQVHAEITPHEGHVHAPTDNKFGMWHIASITHRAR